MPPIYGKAITDLMDEDACYRWIVELLHPEGLACPRCGAREGLKVHRRHRAPVLDYRCAACDWPGTPHGAVPILRRGSSWWKPVGGKTTVPALTVPQVRMGLASLLHRASRCDTPVRVARERTRRLGRNESARFYHKARKQLAPLKRRPGERLRQ